MRIAVDVGYGYTKAMSEEGKELKFPSLVARDPKSSFGFTTAKEDFEISLFEGGEELSFFVGNSAMAAGAVREWEENAAKNRNLLVLVATAISKLLPQDKDEVDIVVGLPMDFFQDQRQGLIKALKKKQLDLELDGNRREVLINDVSVFPQGAGAFYSVIYDLEGEIKNLDYLAKPIAVIDIGYRTTDYLYMARGTKGIVPRPELSGSITDAGMNSAHKLIQSSLKSRLKKEVPIVEIEKALFWASGEFIEKGQTIDLRPLQKQAYLDIAQKITAELKQKWGDEVNRLAAIVIAGGGGDALFRHLSEELPAVTKVEKPDYANAYGYLAAQALSKKK